MLTWVIWTVLVIMLALLGLTCLLLWKRIQSVERALSDKDRGICGEFKLLRSKHDACLKLIGRVNEQAVDLLLRLSDEAERAIGHTRETKWLENLYLDVRFASGAWVKLSDADGIRKAGYAVPDDGTCDLADALRLAIDIDRAARNVELPLQNAFRRCQIARPQTIQWIGEVLAMAQRLQHGDADQARKMLTAAMELWKTCDLPAAVSILEHDPEITMSRG
jgi:hypothetical protein